MPLRPGCATVAFALNPSALGDDWLGQSAVQRLSCPPAPACCSLAPSASAAAGNADADATAADADAADAYAFVDAVDAPTPAPSPTAALSLFVGFPTGSCEPRGGDHPGAALYAASFSLAGKGGCGGKAPSWALSAPGPQFTLASSQFAGITNMLGADAASGRAWGTWLLGQVGGGAPYRQMVTQMTGSLSVPSVDWTCHPPSGAYGVPFFDRRIARASPIYYSNGSFVVYGSPTAADTDDEEDASWVLGGRWDRGEEAAAGGSGGGGDGAELPAELARLAPGTFFALDAGGSGSTGGASGAASASAARRSRRPASPGGVASPEDAPNCTMKRLGAYALPAPGVQRALVFDSTYATPSAVTLTLAGRTVTVQRLSVATGKPVSAPRTLACAKCDEYLYAPTAVANGVATFSTINYTTSVITTFAGALSGSAFAPVAGSQAFVPRESVVLALPTRAGGKGGANAPYPLGLAAMQFSSPSSSWACNNRSTARALHVGAVARAGAPLELLRACTVPLCALPTDDGGCVMPILGFV